jgi:ABC-2 type transport system ATP-binding protein
VIQVAGLTKYYADRPALVDVTFQVPRGQVLGLLGPNGAGKSTTMRILTGFLSATSGTARVAGHDVFQNSLEVRRRIGYLPETNPLYSEMRVVDYLGLMCRLRGVHPRRRAGRIDHAIDACGLGQRRREVIGRLSRGLRQRVGLAQAIVHEPDVLILDEPTSGLDPGQTRETRQLISALGREHTVILSSHVLPEVSATCERVIIIHEGRLVADDRPEDLARLLSSGGVEVEMVLRAEPETVGRRLSRMRGLESFYVEDAGDGQTRALVRSKREDLRERLAKAMVTAGLGLLEIRSRTLSLEDVFLHLTTEEAGRQSDG